MSSPGKDTIATALGNKTYTVEGGFKTQFKADSETIQKLASAIDAGWTSSAPSTITTMATEIASKFSNTLGNGLAYLIALASAIDTETSKWAASFNPLTGLHTYAPTAAAIIATTLAASPIQSAGVTAMAEAVAQVFIDNFEQEVG